MRWSILKVSSCVLTVCSLISGSFYFYTDSQWLQASPNIRFDLLFSLQFSITITICLILILTENNYMPFGYVRRTIVLLRFLSLLIILCFLYSLQQLVSIVLWTIGYSRSGSIGDRLVVYIALWVLTLTTTGTSALLVVMMARYDELNFTEICIKKKDYDEKQVRTQIGRCYKLLQENSPQAGIEFADFYPARAYLFKPDLRVRLAFFWLSQYGLYKKNRSQTALICQYCREPIELDAFYILVQRSRNFHSDCLRKSGLSKVRTNGCEISDAVSELRNLGAPVTHEERDALLRTLLT